ncbi:ras association domain-containing protein 10 [Notolabrus celidotus]|uniref:ras association domain-containing protein 10 n=1 Tax=Notolabrus celidotus TaxID=1203425 RepID=UPI0014904314|nr:ras association domain-containing protein 10 [Notolabrus celidotus]
MLEPEESKISVWVCREEKLVFGLSRRTTCADVVKVLLQDQDSQNGLSAASLSGGAPAYCIVEKWRGFERILPNKTKILRLWVAWGEEQANVKFVLVKSEASLAKHGARSAEARVVPSKHGPCAIKGTARSPMAGISPEKQRRIVRKAFRKLEKMNKKRTREEHKDASSAERMETLVHLVVSQDHTIRQQVQRITELDSEIERREANVHFDRMKRHGVNYVQDTYLEDAASVSRQDGDMLCSAETLEKYEVYVRQCDEVFRLQEELWEQEALIEIITLQMQEELNQRWMQRRTEELKRQDAERAASLICTEAGTESENELLLKEERVRTQLDASLYIGLRLSTDLEAIRSDLVLTEEICAAREKEMRDLLEKVNTLDIEDGTDREGRCQHGTDDETGRMSTLEEKSEWVEQARGLSKAHSVNDDDSDTGLSSLHSQDSDSQPVWESLV